MTWNNLSKLTNENPEPRLLPISSNIKSFLSIVPETISFINFLNLCLGKESNLD